MQDWQDASVVIHAMERVSGGGPQALCKLQLRFKIRWLDDACELFAHFLPPATLYHGVSPLSMHMQHVLSPFPILLAFTCCIETSATISQECAYRRSLAINHYGVRTIPWTLCTTCRRRHGTGP